MGEKKCYNGYTKDLKDWYKQSNQQLKAVIRLKQIAGFIVKNYVSLQSKERISAWLNAFWDRFTKYLAQRNVLLHYQLLEQIFGPLY